MWFLLVRPYHVRWEPEAHHCLARQQTETTVPADILLIHGTCIVNEAMLSGESTPLLKESIQLLDAKENLDVDGNHKNAVLFSGTKILQATPSSTYDTFGYVDRLILTVFSTTGITYFDARQRMPWHCPPYWIWNITRTACANHDIFNRPRICKQLGIFLVHRVPSHLCYRRKLVRMGKRSVFHAFLRG